MEVANKWQDYEILDMANGEKLERWGNITLIRPDPQIIWKNKSFPEKWNMANARYNRSSSGGGAWKYNSKLPENWQIKYKDLKEYEKELIYEYTCNVVAKVSPELKIEEIREKVRKKEGGESMLADALLKMKEKYIVEGKMDGIESGRREEKLKIAKSLKLMGLKIEDIVKATGLSKEEIQKL